MGADGESGVPLSVPDGAGRGMTGVARPCPGPGPPSSRPAAPGGRTRADEVEVPFSAFGARILVRASHAALLPEIERRLPHGAIRGPVAAPDRVLRVAAGPVNRLYSGRRLVARGDRVEPLLGLLRRRLQLAVARFARDYVFVHAGVVAWQGRAVVIPGRSRSGKSTLVAALLETGAGYLSDEFALLDERGWVRAYPRPLSLRRPGGGRTRIRVACPIWHSLPVGAVVLTRYHPHRVWTPRVASAGEAMLGLLANAAPARDAPRRALEAVRRAAAGATVLVGERGDAAETARSLLEMLRVERSEEDAG